MAQAINNPSATQNIGKLIYYFFFHSFLIFLIFLEIDGIMYAEPIADIAATVLCFYLIKKQLNLLSAKMK